MAGDGSTSHTTSKGLSENARLGELYSLISLQHIHNYERWLGASPGGVGPGLETSLTGFRVTSSATANTFGNAITVLDGSETPIQVDKRSFDIHRLQIIGVQNNDKIYRLRFANNSEGHISFADAVAHGVYSDICMRINHSVGNTPLVPVLNMINKRFRYGTKIWAAVATSDAVAQWLDFLIGLHEYDEDAS